MVVVVTLQESEIAIAPANKELSRAWWESERFFLERGGNRTIYYLVL